MTLLKSKRREKKKLIFIRYCQKKKHLKLPIFYVTINHKCSKCCNKNGYFYELLKSFPLFLMK